MKKQVPLALGILIGFFAVLEFYVPWHVVGTWQERFLGWALILSATAFVLGGINVIQVNWPKIRRREQDWQYKVVLLFAAVFMTSVGTCWHELGGERPSGSLTIADAQGAALEPGMALVRVDTTHGDAVVNVVGVDGGQTFVGDGEVVVPAGVVAIKVYKEVAGYRVFTEELELAAGQMARVETDLVMLWGTTGRVYSWLYDHVFAPCNATMFALLAFFIASAAFRAFRARNTEAALLLGSAIIIMLGRAPIGSAISEYLPVVSDWILDVPNNAGRRAIMMGAALGAIVTGLRVILGLERSHLGAD